MRIAFVIAALTAALLASAATPAGPCQKPLPRGPAVPAPLVFTTGCGSFRLQPSGRVNRLPRRWLAAHPGGTGRRYGADLQIRRNRAGRIFVLRRGQLVWRSSRLYPNTGGDIAFGPNSFAFASYYEGVFLTDLHGPERLVLPGRGRFPHDFFASGRLVVTGGRAIAVLSPQGRTERRYPYSRRGGYAFDGRSNTLFFVTPRGRLGTVRESRLRVGRRLDADGMLSLAPERRLVFYGAYSLTVATLDGRVVARARWRREPLGVFDSGASVSPDGRRVAFRLSDARAGAKSGTAVLYLLSAGRMRAEPLYRHRLGRLGCWSGGSMRWHGRQLLYTSADGQVALIDTTSRRRRDLSRFAESLPGSHRLEQPVVGWASDFR